MSRDELALPSSPDAVPTARRFVRTTLSPWAPPGLVDDVALAVTELVTNALLHAMPPVGLVLTSPDGEASSEVLSVRIEVHDGSRRLPVAPLTDGYATTGRGLLLVTGLADQWGAEPTVTGKAVWAVLRTSGRGPAPPSDVDAADVDAADVDADALLARFADDWPDDTETTRFTVTLGDVPTDLLLAAKAHVDSLVRELTLTASGAASGMTSALPPHLADLVHDVAIEFSEARVAIKRQALAAASRGDLRTRLTLTLPADAADAGERYLAALEEADGYARAARLLTIAAPPQHRVFRRWYVTSLLEGLRRAARGEEPVAPPSFEAFLLQAVESFAQLQLASERSARLQRVTAALADALGMEQLARTALDNAVDELGAARGYLLLADATKALGPSSCCPPDLAEKLEQSWRDGRELPSTRARRTGDPVWVESREERDEILGALEEVEPDAAATCAVPLRVGTHVLGVLCLSFLESRLFTADERSFLTALAATAAQALERAQLYESRSQLADRLSRLQEATAALATTRAVDEVLDVTLAHATGLVGARVASLSLLDEDGETIRLVRVHPPLPPGSGSWSTYRITDDLPAAESMRSGELLWVGSVSERDARWPALAPLRWKFEHSLAVLPLHEQGRTVAALTLSFAVGEHRSEPPHEFLMAYADTCAQALERARSAERADRAQRRLTFLAAASAQLGDSLDVARTLGNVARLAVPELADWCVLHLVEDGELAALVVEHVDREKLELARRVQRRWPERLADQSGVGQVVRTGVPLLVPDIPAAAAVAPTTARDPEHVAALRELGLRSVIIVPLVARGRTLGALSFIAAESGRRYDHNDLAFAQDVARRAAVAIDNARLFEELFVRTSGRAFPSGRTGLQGRPEDDAALAAGEVGRFELVLDTGRITVDEQVNRFFGLADGEGARDVAEFFARMHPDDVDRVHAALAVAVEQVGDYVMDHRVLLPEGRVRWLTVRGRVLADASGPTGVLAGVVYDSTDMRDDARQLARVLETMVDAFYRLDTSWRFTHVNAQAEKVLFRRREEMLGRTLWEEFPETVGGEFQRSYERAMRTGQQVSFEEYYEPLATWFEVRATPDSDGLSVFFHRVDMRKAAEDERERANQRLALIASASGQFAALLEPTEVLDKLADLVVPQLGRYAATAVRAGVAAEILGEPAPASDDVVRVVHIRHADRTLEEPLLGFLRSLPLHVTDAYGAGAVIGTERAQTLPRVTEDVIRSVVGDDAAAYAALTALGVSSGYTVPMVSRGRTLGALSIAEPAGTSTDHALVADLAGRAAVALDNALLYRRERRVGVELQRHLLPRELAHIDGIEVATRYLPAAQGALAGGDFYEAVEFGGCLVVALGDVVGHGTRSAARMGQLRAIVVALALQGLSPGQLLGRIAADVDRMLDLGLATLLVARYDPGTRTMNVATAGHPAPLVAPPDAEPFYPELDPGPPLGVGPAEFAELAVHVPADSTVVMFTDGLVENRGESITVGLERLRQALVNVRQPAELVADHVLTATDRERGGVDDVALLVMHHR